MPLAWAPPVAPTSGGFSIASCITALIAAACAGESIIGGTYPSLAQTLGDPVSAALATQLPCPPVASFLR